MEKKNASGKGGKQALPINAKLAFLSLFAVLSLIPLAAQQASGTAGSQASGSDTITFSASRMESVLAKGKEKTVLIGNAVINTGNMEIKADRVELSGADYVNVVCTGNVHVKDESQGFSLDAVTLEYNRNTEIGIAQSQVNVEDSKNKVVMKAEWVRFDQKQSIVEGRIAVHILKEDFAARAEFARFDRNTESLELSGTPVAVSEDGTVVADAMAGKAGMQDLNLTGQVSGTITNKKKEGANP